MYILNIGIGKSNQEALLLRLVVAESQRKERGRANELELRGKRTENLKLLFSLLNLLFHKFHFYFSFSSSLDRRPSHVLLRLLLVHNWRRRIAKVCTIHLVCRNGELKVDVELPGVN